MPDIIITLSVFSILALPLAVPWLLPVYARVLVVLIAPFCWLIRPDMRR